MGVVWGANEVKRLQVAKSRLAMPLAFISTAIFKSSRMTPPPPPPANWTQQSFIVRLAFVCTRPCQSSGFTFTPFHTDKETKTSQEVISHSKEKKKRINRKSIYYWNRLWAQNNFTPLNSCGSSLHTLLLCWVAGRFVINIQFTEEERDEKMTEMKQFPAFYWITRFKRISVRVLDGWQAVSKLLLLLYVLWLSPLRREGRPTVILIIQCIKWLLAIEKNR